MFDFAQARHFNGGQLTVSISQNRAGGDVLSLGGATTIDDDVVLVDGIAIGSLASSGAEATEPKVRIGVYGRSMHMYVEVATPSVHYEVPTRDEMPPAAPMALVSLLSWGRPLGRDKHRDRLAGFAQRLGHR